MLSDLTLKGSCHSGCFDRLGMIGLVPMPLFQRRPWCAHMLRTVFMVTSQDSSTRELTPKSFASLFLISAGAPLKSLSMVPKSIRLTSIQ